MGRNRPRRPQLIPVACLVVPLPRVVAHLNKRYTNQFIEPVVRRFGGFAVVTHHGRRSGATYRTPIFLFEEEPAGDMFVALTYGPSADWARNVMHSGGTIDRSDSDLSIDHAAIVGRDKAWPHLPPVVRLWLRLLRVTDFMQMQTQGQIQRHANTERDQGDANNRAIPPNKGLAG